MSACSLNSVNGDSPTETDICSGDHFVSLFSILAWDISKKPNRSNDDVKNGTKRKHNKDEDRIQQVRMKTMEESVHLASDMPQLYLLCNIASTRELEDISTLAGLDQPGWISSNSFIGRPAASTIMWTTAIDCGFHMRASYGSRRLARDRSIPEMFSIESILLVPTKRAYMLLSTGSGESKSALGHLDVRLDPKRTCFSIMNIWLESNCMDVMTGVYCCSPKTHPVRRADVLRRFLFMARQAAAEHTKGNLILFASPGMAHQRCHFDEILQTIASVDLNMAEECYIADGGCFITFESPLASFRLDDIRAIDMGLAVRKNLLKVEIDVPFADEELCDYFEKQPMFFSISVKKHILFNEQPRRPSPSPEQLRLRLNQLLLEKNKLDALGYSGTDILLSSTGKPIELPATVTDEEIKDIVYCKRICSTQGGTTKPTGQPISAGTWPSKMNAHGNVEIQPKVLSITDAHNMNSVNNVISMSVNPSSERQNKMHNLTSKRTNRRPSFNGLHRMETKRTTQQNSEETDKEENILPRNSGNWSSEKLHSRATERLECTNSKPPTLITVQKSVKMHNALRMGNKPNSQCSANGRSESVVSSDTLRTNAAHVVRRIPPSIPTRIASIPTSISLSLNKNDKNNNSNPIVSRKGDLKQSTNGKGRVVRITAGTTAKTAILKEKSNSNEKIQTVGVHLIRNELKM